MASRKPSQTASISHEAFVRAWQSAKTVAEAAKAVGVSTYTASHRAYRLRKLGVKLKKFPTSTTNAPADVEKLNQIIKDLGDGHG